MGSETVERKWVLTRIKPGDYLLPSNDGETIWRIMRYEDGPSHGLTDWDHDREFWGIWRWLPDRATMVDTEDWDAWGFTEGMCDTRAEAINTALRLNPV